MSRASATCERGALVCAHLGKLSGLVLRRCLSLLLRTSCKMALDLGLEAPVLVLQRLHLRLQPVLPRLAHLPCPQNLPTPRAP